MKRLKYLFHLWLRDGNIFQGSQTQGDKYSALSFEGHYRSG